MEVVILTVTVNDPEWGKMTKIHSIHHTIQSVTVQIELLKKHDPFLVAYKFTSMKVLDMTREHNETAG